MNMKIVSAVLAVAALGCAKEPEFLQLTRHSASPYTIVTEDELTPAGEFLFTDFTNLLTRATGVDFKVRKSSGRPREKRIFFGIAPAGAPELPDQVRRVAVIGDDLYLYGGGANGTRYAVYDFLVNDLGYRFFDGRGGMRVPDARNFAMPRVDRCRRHDFAERYISIWGRYTVPESSMFFYRHGLNGKIAQLLKRDKLGEAVNDYDVPHPGDASLVHYLPRNSKSSTIGWIKKLDENLEKDHPEYFTLDRSGKRVFDHQRCLSNPQVRALLEKRVLEQMRRVGEGTIFDLSAGDTSGAFCHGEGCRALEGKYGTPAGPLLDVFMELCPKAAARFPDKALMTLVYRKNQTQRPPKGITAMPDNFVAHFAPIDDDFAKDWTHPNNADTLADLKEWTRLCRRTLMWYYPNPYGEYVTPPFGNVERLVNDIRIMKEAGVTGVTFEHNVGVTEMTGFTELQSYIMLRLFDDVTLDWRRLADEFLEFEYGDAAAGVKAYWLELEELRKAMDYPFAWNPSLLDYRYFTPERLLRWSSVFDALEKTVSGDKTRLANVRRLRIALDLVVMRNYATFKKSRPSFRESFPDLVGRIRTVAREIQQTAFTGKYAGGKSFMAKIEELIFFEKIRNGANAKPLPKEIFGDVPENRLYVNMARCPWRKNFEPDEKAAFGITAVFDGEHRGDVMAVPFRANIEHVADKKYIPNVGRVAAKDLGPRGEYKFYRLCSAKITPSTVLELGAWSAFRCPIGGAYEMGSFNNVTIYASLKFEGPAFYREDAGKRNMICCDRVVVVKNPQE